MSIIHYKKILHKVRFIYLYHIGAIFKMIAHGEVSSCPSLSFEEQTNIEISGKYILPKPAHMLEIKSRLFGNDNWDSPMLRELVTTNPELESIDIDYENEHEVRNIIHGIYSRFSPDDISFFLNYQIRKENLAYSKDTYQKIVEIIEEKTGISMYWVASPKTIITILQHLDIPDNLPEVQDFRKEFSEYL